VKHFLTQKTQKSRGHSVEQSLRVPYEDQVLNSYTDKIMSNFKASAKKTKDGKSELSRSTTLQNHMAGLSNKVILHTIDKEKVAEDSDDSERG